MSRSLPAPLRVLTGGQFGLFYAGNGLSLIGTWMQRIACGWLVWDWTHSAFWLGILSAGDLLPVMAIGPLAGVAADRWDRLRQNILAQVATAVIAILAAVLLATNHLSIAGIVLLTTAQGTLAAIIQPARLSMIQQLVSREDLGTAVALNSVNVNLARLIGPAAAGVMILYADIVWVFAVNALVTLLFVFVLTRLRLVAYVRTRTGRGFLVEMVEGFAYILRVQPLWLILLAMLCGGSMARAMAELMPALAARVFVDNATGLAVLTGAAAVGAVCSGLSMGSRDHARLLSGALVWWGVAAVAAVLLTRAPSVVTAVGAAVLLGFSITRGLISTQTFVQLTTPDELRGRVLSVHGLIARGSPALGALVIGFFADRIGLSNAVAWSSTTLLLTLLLLIRPARRALHRPKETT